MWDYFEFQEPQKKQKKPTQKYSRNDGKCVLRKTVLRAEIPAVLHLKKSTLSCWMKVHLWTPPAAENCTSVAGIKHLDSKRLGGVQGRAAARTRSSSETRTRTRARTRTNFSSMNPRRLTLALTLALTLLAVATAQPQQLSHDHHDMGWVNGYRQGFNFQCPPGEVLVAIRSYYSQQDGSDRLWTFECQPTPEGLGEASDCWWDDINRAGMEWWAFVFVVLDHIDVIIAESLCKLFCWKSIFGLLE